MKRIYFTFLILLVSFMSTTYALDLKHEKWNQILSTHVTEEDGQTLFMYKKLKENKENLEKFESYLADLSNVKKDKYDEFSSNQKFSFLVNAYNAFTVKLILDNYPLKSIREIGFLPGAAWRKDFFKLFGEKTDLGHIEHEMLRKDFNEPRLHYVINCASIGCPNLQPEAFTAENMEILLVKGEKDFFDQKSKNRVEESKKIVHVSKIFDWFDEDFEKKHGSLRKYLAKIFNNKDILNEEYKIKHTDYDWALNESK